jgi:hypothetical protein
VLSGTFSSVEKNIKLTGSINKEGFVESNLTFDYKLENTSLKEVRVFENGVFKDHYLLFNGEKIQIAHLGLDLTYSDNENWETTQINTLYSDLIELTTSGLLNPEILGEINLSDIEKQIEKSNRFLKKTLKSFGSFDTLQVWSLIDGSEAFNYPKVKIRKFPFSEAEKKQIKNIKENFAHIDSTIKKFLKSSQVEVSKYAYEDLSYFYEVISIYKLKLKSIQKANSIIRNPAFEYVDREAQLKQVKLEVNFPDKVDYLFKDEQKSKKHSFPSNFDPQLQTVENLDSFLAATKKDIDVIIKKTNVIIDRYQRQEKLNEKEDKLIQLKDTLKIIFKDGSEEMPLNEFHKEFSNDVIAYTEKSFKDYATSELDIKIELIDKKLDCFNSFTKLYEVLNELPRKLTRVDEVYTRTTWNPFIAIDMEERVKERVYNAYEKILLPFVLDNLKENLNCNEIESKTENINLLYKGMIQLRDADTKSEERALRRETDPREILSILNIKLNL